MKELQIVTPVYIDNEKRKRNYNFHNQYYSANGYDVDYFIVDSFDRFHKTKICNDLYKKYPDKIIFMCDLDIIVSPSAIAKIHTAIQQKPKTVGFPFKNIVYIDPEDYSSDYETYNHIPHFKIQRGWEDTPRVTLQDLVKYSSTDIDLDLSNLNFYNRGYRPLTGFGVMFDFEEYRKIGLDNEYILNYQYDDLERYDRCLKFGFDVAVSDIDGYHMDHIGDGASLSIKFHNNRSSTLKQNTLEYLKVMLMNKQELEHYISTWKW